MHYSIGSSPWVSKIYETDPVLLGFGISCCYVLGELTNSFIKRRLGIKPGEVRSKTQRVFDHIDGMIAVGPLLYFGYRVGLEYLAASFMFSFALHWFTQLWMRKLGLKKH